jgi:hypothetical protein
MSRIAKLAVLVAGALWIWSGAARADAVTDWNAIAVQTIVNAGAAHGSAAGFLDSATVQAAVYDAVEAINGPLPAVPHASPWSVGYGCGSDRQGGA